MDNFTLLDIEGANNAEKGYRLTLEWDNMFMRYIISLYYKANSSRKKASFAAKVDIIHIQRLQDGLISTVKYMEDNDLNQPIK